MLQTRIRTMLAISAAALLALSGCGARNDAAPAAAPTNSTAPAPSTGAASGGAELLGKTFTASQITGLQVADLSKITIGFADGAIQASAGCNSLSGEVDSSGGTITAPLTQTEMFCEGLMDQEKWLSDFIAAGPTWTYSDGTLTLTKADATLTLKEDAAAGTVSAPLAGTRWKLNSIITGDTASSVPSDVDPVITIADGRIVFDAQCNSVGGEVEITDTTLDITNVIGTLMACGDPRDEMESLLTTTISGKVNYSITGDTLTIEGAENTTLEFVVDADGVAETATETASGTGSETTGGEPSAVPTEKIDNSIPQIPEDSTVTEQKSEPATIDPTLAGLSFTTPIPDAPNGEVITLSFSERILTNASCNSIGSQGAQSTADGVLTVGNLLSTRMFCAGLSDSENAWMDFLQSKPSWTLDGSTLTLTSAGATYKLTSTP